MGVGGTMTRALGAGRRAWGSGGQGDNSGEDMDDGDSSDEDDDSNFDFHRSLNFLTLFFYLHYLRIITRIDKYMLRCHSLQIRPTTRTTS